MKKWIWLTIVLLSACSRQTRVNPTITKPAENVMSIRYLALGDSYTIGESVQESERFPNQLASLLTNEGHLTEVTIIARTGWTTNELWEGIQRTNIQPPYDLVSLLIGVNNQYRGYDSNEYREEFRFLLNKSIEYAGGDVNRVFVFSIPDWGVTRFAAGQDVSKIGAEIDLFNSINREETEKAGAHYVDITPISRKAVDDISLIARDSLHPSGSMYAQWVQLALPDVLNVLK
jgi:lysophospholipase L1-like esterase